MLRRYARLWGELLVVSWHRVPVLTVSMFTVEIALLLPVIGWAWSLRATVNAADLGSTGTAVAAAIGAAVVCMLSMVLNSLGGYLLYYTVDKVAEQDVRPAIARDIATLEGTEHLERSDFLDRITVLKGASWGIAEGGWQAIGSFFAGVRLVGSLLLLGSVSYWHLFLVLFAAAPLWCDRQARALVNQAETDTAEAFRLQRQLFELATSAEAGKELRVAQAGEELVRRQQEAWNSAVKGRYRARLHAAWWQVAGWTCFATGFVAGLAAVVYQMSRGTASAGDVVLVVTVASALQQTMQAAVSRATLTLACGRLTEPYLWLRDYVSAERARHSGTRTPPTILREGITLDDVGYTYPGTKRPALDQVSVHLPAGQVVALVGTYGSGKTTLVKLLGKFYRASTGTIRVDGTDLGEVDTTRWRARTSAVYQDFGRYQQTTVGESVGLGDLARLDDLEALTEAVRAADANSVVAGLPQGFDTRLGRALDGDGVSLSEGQWQKVALARAAMRTDPLLLVLDEPTASLDAPSEHAVFRRSMDEARRLARTTGAITLIVSHRFSTVTEADMILVLDNGKLMEHGTHDELLSLGGRYAGLYAIQAAAHSL